MAKQLGPFELQDVIGRGGMGTVYRARNVETDEIVAVKALSPAYTSDPHFRNRFESEIQALIKLDHPNIVRLKSYGQEDGNLYFAMELVEGKSLFHLQKERTKFDWRETLNVAKDVALGLRHAHDRGIIHRDLKPGNLLRSPDGVVKITDFGIAKRFGTNQNTDDNVLGTIDFMSPEQAKGQPVTVRSDLFSLGVVLYTMLAGRPPFTSNSMEESLRNLTSVPAPSLAASLTGLPVQIDQLISNLIEKKPEARIPTAQVLLKRLSDIENELRQESEVATTHGTPAPIVDSHDITRVDDKTEVESGKTGNDRHPKSKVKQSRDVTSALGITLDDTDSEYQLQPPEEKKDYYNTVTDEQRRQSVEFEQEEEPTSDYKSIVGLAIALLAVLAVAGFGLFQAFKTPSADDLFSQITNSERKPQKVIEEIETFIEAYPDDERIDEVTRLRQIAKSISYYNTKSLLYDVSGEAKLTKMQREFVKVINKAREDSVFGFTQLRAFITVHDAAADESEESIRCLAAAKGYLVKLRKDASTSIGWHQESIEKALERAAEQSPTEQVKVYRAIIELYGDIEWAESIVEETREKLKIVTQS